jgi:protoheme IX farnesyltransferase
VTDDQVRLTDPLSFPSGGGAAVRAYLELTKPRIIELLLVTTVPAMFVAAGGWPGGRLIAATLVGGTLSAAGANAINQVLDRDIDRIMNRTRRRPLPTDRIEPGRALAFGIVLGAAGFVWLWQATNMLAAVLSTLGLLVYVVVYTMFLKRSSTQNIVIGGAAGAVPVLVGWAAVADSLALPAWVMFAIVFFWTPPHFWALALRYKDEYAAAGVPMLPVVVGERQTIEHMSAYTIILVGVSLLLYPLGAVGWIYLGAALSLGVWLFASVRGLMAHAGDAMRFFGYSNVYLAGLFTAMAVDRLFA